MLVPKSDHNMHMDNPIAFANLIINDLLYASGEIKEKLPVFTVDEYLKIGVICDSEDY